MKLLYVPFVSGTQKYRMAIIREITDIKIKGFIANSSTSVKSRSDKENPKQPKIPWKPMPVERILTG